MFSGGGSYFKRNWTILHYNNNNNNNDDDDDDIERVHTPSQKYLYNYTRLLVYSLHNDIIQRAGVLFSTYSLKLLSENNYYNIDVL